ncbi:uncharacterized protein LOC144206534 [Stigmatopora nigra]
MKLIPEVPEQMDVIPGQVSHRKGNNDMLKEVDCNVGLALMCTTLKMLGVKQVWLWLVLGWKTAWLFKAILRFRYFLVQAEKAFKALMAHNCQPTSCAKIPDEPGGYMSVRALQSSSEVTICRRNPVKLLTGRCRSFGPHIAQNAGKHQECGENDQKGAACRRHNKKSTKGDQVSCLCTDGSGTLNWSFFSK